MGNTVEKLTYEYMEAESIKVINLHKLMFISYIFGYVEFSSATFYEKGVEKSEPIKKLLKENRIGAKKKMLANWSKKDAAPALQMGFMKLAADDEEWARLSGAKIKVDQETTISEIEGKPLEEQISMLKDVLDKLERSQADNDFDTTLD